MKAGGGADKIPGNLEKKIVSDIGSVAKMKDDFIEDFRRVPEEVFDMNAGRNRKASAPRRLVIDQHRPSSNAILGPGLRRGDPHLGVLDTEFPSQGVTRSRSQRQRYRSRFNSEQLQIENVRRH